MIADQPGDKSSQFEITDDGSRMVGATDDGPKVLGTTVTVDDFASINAAAGTDGIRAFNYGIGGTNATYRSSLDDLGLGTFHLYHRTVDVVLANSGAFADRGRDALDVPGPRIPDSEDSGEARLQHVRGPQQRPRNRR